MEAPEKFKAALDIINEGRVKIGRSKLKWHDALHKSAQELTDKGWANIQEGLPIEPHWDHLDRIERSGWKVGGPPPKMRPGWPYNHSEDGISGGSSGGGDFTDQDGWSYRVNPPEKFAKDTVYAYTESNLSTNHTEGHVWDFRLEAWTHIGLGHTGGMFAMNYGWLPTDEDDDQNIERGEFNFL